MRKWWPVLHGPKGLPIAPPPLGTGRVGMIVDWQGRLVSVCPWPTLVMRLCGPSPTAERVRYLQKPPLYPQTVPKDDWG